MGKGSMKRWDNTPQHDKTLGWHIIRPSRRLGFDSKEIFVAPGFVYSYVGKEPPTLCNNGMHASELLHDAIDIAERMNLVDRETKCWAWICRVTIYDKVVYDWNKMVGRHRDVLWMVPYRDVIEYQMRAFCRLDDAVQKVREKLMKKREGWVAGQRVKNDQRMASGSSHTALGV